MEAIKVGDLESTYLLADVFVGFPYIWWATKIVKGEKVPDKILSRGVLTTKDNVDATMGLKKDMKENITNFEFEKTLPETIDTYVE